MPPAILNIIASSHVLFSPLFVLINWPGELHRYYYTVDTKQNMFYSAISAELEAASR